MTARVVIVTGASGGIGGAIARHLARAGDTVIGTSRADPAWDRLDVADEANCRSLVERVLARQRRIDALVNRAGVAMLGPVEGFPLADLQAVLDVNLLGAVPMSRAVLPTMRRQGRGRLVHVNSVVGFMPGPFMGLYAASKHALEGFSKYLDHGLRGSGVRSVVVRPGFMRSAIAQNGLVAPHETPGTESSLARFSAALARALVQADDP